MASVTEAEQVLKVRDLHSGVPGDSRSSAFTKEFNEAANTNGGKDDYEGMYGVGVIVGFVLTGIFMIFAMAWIILDEIQRHKAYAAKIDEYRSRLMNKY